MTKEEFGDLIGGALLALVAVIVEVDGLTVIDVVEPKLA